MSLERRSTKTGLPPGSLIHIGNPSRAPVEVTLIDYDRDQIQERRIDAIKECFPFKETEAVTWINIDGLHQVELVQALDDSFGIHPLILEDILNTQARPKSEEHESYLYFLVKMLRYDMDSQCVQTEQLSLIVGDNYLISLQEEAANDIFDPVRKRLRDSRGRIRRKRADYLAYVLLDTVVDHNFLVLEQLGDRIEDLEDDLLAHPEADNLQEIQRLKREILSLRHAIWPLRELISGLYKEESPLIQEETRLYFKDVHDHVIQIIETIELFRELVAGMLEIYRSNLSSRMNEVMKVLTIFSTIFIPLTFVVGVYGMNFEYMPELKWGWGYAALWIIMGIVTGIMLLFFRRKKWL